MKGVYQHCKEKHLHRYLSEFHFRYSNRIALGVNNGERRTLAINGASGKRLTYWGASPSLISQNLHGASCAGAPSSQGQSPNSSNTGGQSSFRIRQLEWDHATFGVIPFEQVVGAVMSESATPKFGMMPWGREVIALHARCVF